jgi:hypothetical protein
MEGRLPLRALTLPSFRSTQLPYATPATARIAFCIVIAARSPQPESERFMPSRISPAAPRWRVSRTTARGACIAVFLCSALPAPADAGADTGAAADAAAGAGVVAAAGADAVAAAGADVVAAAGADAAASAYVRAVRAVQAVSTQAVPAASDAAGRAAARRTLMATRTITPPSIDGRLDDSVWRLADAATGFVQRAPDAGAAASQRTEARVLYDDAAIYIALRMFDDAPDSIVARLARRDELVHSDWVHVQIGSMDDGRSAFVFGVNPRGVQRDVLISEDGTRDASWNAVWHAATAIDSLGWTAELRIPLSQLRFAAGTATWAFNIERTIARRAETSHWSATPPDAAGIVSHFGALTGLVGLSAPRRLEVQPYVVTSITRAPVDAADPFHSNAALDRSAGADVKYGVTGSLTLTATINPDFGQVEADPSEVNLTAYESFMSEQRPFFVEGADLFRAGGPNLFYSRRIGRAPRAALPGDAVFSDYPTATSILGAAKLTGSAGRGWNVGVLSAVTAAEHARYATSDGVIASAPVEPRTAYSVLRARRELDHGRTAFGVLATAVNRQLGDEPALAFLPGSAYAATADGRRRVGGNHEVYASLSGSAVFGSTTALRRLQRSATHRFQRPDAPHLEYDSTSTSMLGHALRLGARRMGGGPWRWDIGLNTFSPGFEINDAGFLNDADRMRALVSAGYEQHRGGTRLRSWMLSAFQYSEWTYGGERLGTVFDVDGTILLQSHRGANVWVQRELGGLAVDALRGGPAIVAPAQARLFASGHTDRRRALNVRGSFFVETEDDAGSVRANIGGTVQFRPSRALEASLGPRLARTINTWQYVAARQTADGERYIFARLQQTTAALTARLAYALSPELSLQVYAQPFVAVAEFGSYSEVADPRARRFDERFHVYGDGEIVYDDAARRFTVARDGMAPMSFGRPDFRRTALRGTAVLRWEYRPGSTLFVVWGSARDGGADDGTFDLRRDLRGVFGGTGPTTVLVKGSYWLGR